MPHASSRLSTVLVALLLGACVGCGVLPYEAHRTLDARVDVPAAVSLASAGFVHGDLQVVGGDAPTLALHAEVTVTASTQQIADEVAAALEIGFPVEGERLRVVVSPREDRWSEDDYALAVTSRLDVPRGLALELATTHGDLSLDGVSGRVEASTTHGDLAVRGTRGELSLASTHGAVALDDVRGGPVTVSTTHGDLVAHGLGAPFTLTTTHGSVDLDLGPVSEGRSAVVTTHGDVSVRLGETSRVTVEAATTSDQVTSDFPGLALRDDGRRGTLRLGASGDARLEITTSHGDVALLRSVLEERM